MAIKKIGALWLKEGKNGKFLSGMLEVDGKKINLLVFRNDNKKEDRHPDYTINITEDDDADRLRTNRRPPEDSSIPF